MRDWTPNDNLFMPADFKFKNSVPSSVFGLASKEISTFGDMRQCRAMWLMIFSINCGFISEGVPPPKNIDVTSSRAV